MKLLTDSCKDSARSALRFEGQATLQSSFQVLGPVAGMELFSDPEVAKGMAGLDKHVDPAKLKSLTDETSAPR